MRRYWVACVLTGFIPLFISLALIIGCFRELGGADYTDKDILIVGGSLAYMALILALGHIEVFNANYKSAAKSMGRFKGYRTVLTRWCRGNALWHGIGLVLVPLGALFLASAIITPMEVSWIGMLGTIDDVDVAATLLVGGFLGLAIYLFMIAICVVVLFSFPMALISSTIFRLMCLKRSDV